MRAIEKAGWTALGITLFGVIAAFAAFMYFGPGKIQRDILWLARPEVYEAVFPRAITLHDSLNDRDLLKPDDSRGNPIREAVAPLTYTVISKDESVLNIYFGGGFQQFGYRLEKKNGAFRLILAVEEKPDRILK
jgi:hypothetical protein